MSGNTATGTFEGSSNVLSGSGVDPPLAGVVDGTADVFDRPEFTPPLDASDAAAAPAGRSSWPRGPTPSRCARSAPPA